MSVLAAALGFPLVLAPDGTGEADVDADAARDARLVKAALKDPDAYRHLVGLYQARVYATALRMLGNESDVHDAAQEAFLRAYRALHRFQEGKRFGPWICAIVANVARDQLRDPVRRFLRVGLERPGGEAQGRPSDDVEKKEQAAILEDALLRIRPKLREALVLRYVADLSVEEVAEALGIGESAAKMRLKRGLEKLEAILREGC